MLPDGDCTFDCDGFIILAMNDKKLTAESVIGVSIEDLSNVLMESHASSYIIRSASILTEGKNRSFEVAKQAQKMKKREDILRFFCDMGE